MLAPRQSPTELLARLVAFDTTSHRSNLPLIAFVRDYLEAHGVRSHLLPSEDGHKASLFASIGPQQEGGVVLSGHSDCVPVDGQEWSHDPFTLCLREGLLYGRGACDMKGFLACVLASVPCFVAAALKQPIHIAISYDEEVGCLGVRPMLDALGESLPKPALAIIGEPTNMAVVEAQKAISSYTTVVTGVEGHSASPAQGVNAIAYAMRLIRELEKIGTELAAMRDERFDPPYSTLQVGTIEGGTATNIIPQHCRFTWQVRALPEIDADTIPQRLAGFAEAELLPEMRTVSPKVSIRITRNADAPGFLAREGSEAVSLALRLTGQNKPTAVSYGTEAGLFERAGCEAAICGPGDIAQAHAADEYVSVAQLEGCMTFLARLAGELAK